MGIIINERFWNQPVFTALHDNPGDKRKDGHKFTRDAIFLRLLTACAAGDTFASRDDMRMNLPFCSQYRVQCDAVWNVCIKLGVLKQEQNGKFSAVDWLTENGILYAPKNRVKTSSNRRETVKAGNPSPAVEIARKGGENRVKSTLLPTPTADRENRIAVRQNIWLSHEEIGLLQKDFTTEEMTEMADYYSQWKYRHPGEIHITDYQAFRRWVYKILKRDKSDKTKQLSDAETADILEKWS